MKSFCKTSVLEMLVLMLYLLLLAPDNLSGAEGDSAPKANPLRFKKQIDTFIKWDSKNSVPADATLFVGSSSIVSWATHDFFPDMKVINRGFGGAHISDVNFFADSIVLPYKPKVIVFYAGDNDIAGKKSPKRVFDDYQRFVKLVRAELPKIPIIFIAIKPSIARWSLADRMNQANSMIEDLSSRDDKLFFVDISVGLLDAAGKPDKKLFARDGLHLNEAGYKVWTRMVKPVIITASLSTKPKKDD